MRISSLVKKHLTIWGVGLESDLPPEFYISDHAYERLRQRVGVKPENMKRLVAKAWYSKDVPVPRLALVNNKNAYLRRNRVGRECMGKIYVFAYSKQRYPFPPQKVLVTVI